jgi:hypothetical protein
MASKIILLRAKQTVNLAGCFVLLLYTLSGLMFQGGMWLLSGAFCWFVIVGGFLVSHIYCYHKKRLQEISFKTDAPKNRKGEAWQERGSFQF